MTGFIAFFMMLYKGGVVNIEGTIWIEKLVINLRPEQQKAHDDMDDDQHHARPPYEFSNNKPFISPSPVNGFKSHAKHQQYETGKCKNFVHDEKREVGPFHSLEYIVS